VAIAGRTDLRGWGVPVATDIALAVGVLTMLGASVAPSLRTFLLGLAVIDDIGAILIIAFIYSTGIGIKWVLAACLAILVIVGFSKFGFVHPLFYIVLGIFLWYFIYRSGIHATLAGVILGLLTPNIAKTRSGTIDVEDGEVSIIEWLEEKLHPWTSFLIVPIFAFANTGVEISTDALQRAINSHIAWGIICGLVAGKPLGIFFSIILARKLRIGSFPEGASKGGLFATGSAAGIGFTVAIFIAQLAFREKASQEIAIMAVIIASITSGLVSFISFKLVARRTVQNIQ
jgi:NhaA family Na+:H+ antiporter